MKILYVVVALIAAPLLLWAVDDYAGRSDLYGPAATQWAYSTVSSTATIKSSGGVLHCVTVSSAPANVWSLRDANTVGGAVVISTFPASATVGQYCYDIATTNGIQVVLPASLGCSITVSYR